MKMLSKPDPVLSPPADDALVIVDFGLRIMSCNATARAFFKTDFKPGDPFHLNHHFAGADLVRATEALQQAFEQGRVATGLKTGGDGLTSCRYSIHPLYADEARIIGATLCFRTTATARASMTIRRAQPDAQPAACCERRKILDALPEGVFTIDTQWRIVAFNHTAEKITGYRREEVIGRTCREVFRSDLCDSGCPLGSTLESGQMSMDQEICMLGKDGTPRRVLVNVGALRDHNGRIIGGVETFRPLNGVQLPSSPVAAPPGQPHIIGHSQAMQRLLAMLPDLAASDANVMICGESGTGKELFARTIHNLSPRAQNPFAAVNCAALAETLLESELFGHEKAAFTGAVSDKPGRFERAAGGTLFLDEIGDLKPELQVKLLRVIEQKEFERVGGTRTIAMNARIVSATNRDLKHAIASGRFREDFYYRLRTVTLNLPPLRERREDIPLLADFFIRRFNRQYNKRVRTVDTAVMRHFMDYHWPGNIRELEHALEHAFVFVKGPMILKQNLPAADEPATAMLDAATRVAKPATTPISRETLLWALSQARGNRRQASELLGISRTSLWRGMKACNLL